LLSSVYLISVIILIFTS